MTEHTPDDLACRDLVEMVTDYLEGALPAEQARRVAVHLDGCPGCVEYVRQMRATAGSLCHLPNEPLDPRVKSALLQAFRDFPRDTDPDTP